MPGTRGLVLQSKQWGALQIEYMRWLSLPPKLRAHKNETELAIAMGIRLEYFSRWRKRPGFDIALRKTSLQVQLDMDIEFRKAQIANMVKPSGWQERIAYYRYQYQPMLDAAATGELDEISRSQFDTEENVTKLTPDQVRAELSNQNKEVQDLFIRMLSGLDRLQLPDVNEMYQDAEDSMDMDSEGHPTYPHEQDRFVTTYEIPEVYYDAGEAAGPRPEGVVRKNRNGAGGKRERRGEGPEDTAE